MPTYPKRLIEVDLPIRRISVHARREKSIRHGHISTLHIWWARRPLAACRAVICAALWPDPADPLCPVDFVHVARNQMLAWAPHERQMLLSVESRPRFEAARKEPQRFDKLEELRAALLDFIADFANWDNSTVREYLDTSRALTQAAHEALGGAPGTRPLVVDPFAGGGSIPLEALRVGADAFASDLNPVPVLLNKVVLEYIPKYGQRLADEVRKWGEWIRREAEKELAEFYPKDADGATPIAYLWARTIQCEGPGCGAEVPLLRSLWLAKKSKRSVVLQIVPNREKRRVDFHIIQNAKAADVGRGTSAGGTATCPICGFTTPVESVRTQLVARKGGAHDARLIAVVINRPNEIGQFFRAPTPKDDDLVRAAKAELKRRAERSSEDLPLIPDGHINHLRGFFNVVLYGITEWGHIFSPRQALTLSTFARLVRELPLAHKAGVDDQGLIEAVKTGLALIVDRVAVRCTANCIWDATTGCIMQIFNQGQSLPARWEFAEMSPCIDAGSGWATCVDYTIKVMVHVGSISHEGHAERASATAHPLPTDSAQAIITDPPYYAAIPYADLSDFFFSWLKRSLTGLHQELLKPHLTEKPPAFKEWPTRAVRDALYASPLFPRLLNSETIKDIIVRGVQNSQLAYVGKTPEGKYDPFLYGSAASVTAMDIEVSDDMFIVTKETAEAYRKQQTTAIPGGAPQPGAPTPGAPGMRGQPSPAPIAATPVPAAAALQQTARLAWSGEVPPQKWMNFYTRVLSKFATGNGLKLTVSVEVAPDGGVSRSKVDETRSALRELGLNDNLSQE